MSDDKRKRLEAILATPVLPPVCGSRGIVAGRGPGAIPRDKAAIPVPPQMQHLDRDQRGYVIPYFVARPPGREVDFRLADEQKKRRCLAHPHRCWVCGTLLEPFQYTFVLGPMCGVNRNSSEPACHLECGRYSVMVCPFLSKPRMRRDETDMPEAAVEPEGFIARNPGVSLLWTTASFFPYLAGDSVLIRVAEPLAVEYYREGRPATRREVEEAIVAGLPTIEALAAKQGPKALRALDDMAREFRRVVARTCPVESLP